MRVGRMYVNNIMLIIVSGGLRLLTCVRNSQGIINWTLRTISTMRTNKVTWLRPTTCKMRELARANYNACIGYNTTKPNYHNDGAVCGNDWTRLGSIRASINGVRRQERKPTSTGRSNMTRMYLHPLITTHQHRVSYSYPRILVESPSNIRTEWGLHKD